MKCITPIIVACACLMTSVASADTLRVTVSGLHVDKGNLRLAVFNESRGDQFPEGMFLYGVDLPAGQSEMTVAIAGVKPDKYAIAAFQDANQNQKLDRDAEKTPTEHYGFSIFSGDDESTFEQALFDTRKYGYDVSITLK